MAALNSTRAATLLLPDRVLETLFPRFEQAEVRLADGSTMRTVRAGDGPVLLLLHGYPETLCAWHRIAPVLAARYHVIAADLPGYGGSRLAGGSAYLDAPSRRTVAALIAEMMDVLGFHEFAIVGHDRGARAGYRLALDFPERVAALASLTVVPTLDVWEAIDGEFALRAPHWFFFTQPAEVLERLLSPDPVAYLDHVLGRMAGGLHHLDPNALADYRTAFARREVREAIYRDYHAASSVDLAHERDDREAGRKLRCPVLYLWSAGRTPTAEPQKIWRRWASDVSDAGIPGGHMQPEREPEAVVGALVPFLDRCFAAAAPP